MSDDGKTKLPVNVDIGAKAEVKLEVKAEIPPESAGRLVENISDAFRYWTAPKALKPGLLRLQQEEVALKIAQFARTRIEAENALPGSVKAKLLIPIFERGSCEDIDDEIMIERWGNLLASAALEMPVQPRFVGILDELAGPQAKLLEVISFGETENVEFPYTSFGDSAYNYDSHYVKKEIYEYASHRLGNNCELEELFEELVDKFISCGVFLEAMFLDTLGECQVNFECDSAGKLEGNYISDLAILQSLGLIRREIIEFQIVPESIAIGSVNLFVCYYHLTQLGVNFCESCCRPTVENLKEIQRDNDSRGDKK